MFDKNLIMIAKYVSFVICCVLLYLVNSFSIAGEGYYTESINSDIVGFVFTRFTYNFIVSSILACLSYLIIRVFTMEDRSRIPLRFVKYYFESQTVYTVFFIVYTAFFVFEYR